jgi:aspartyl-tRNA(Asn)/glutamyl-tRNA(Gln) amidotransferase subunit B
MRVRFAQEYGLAQKDIDFYIQNKPLADLFEAVASGVVDPAVRQKATNLITSDMVYFLDTEEGASVPRVQAFVSIVELFAGDQITSRGAKDLLKMAMTDSPDLDPGEYARAHGLIQQNDSESLRPIIETILASNQVAVQEYRAGKESVLQFLLGQVMKETRGSANPKTSMEILRELLGAVESSN